MSDSSSEEELNKVVAPKQLPVVDSDSSDDEAPAKVTPASTPARKASGLDRDDSEDKLPKKAVAKAAADSSSDEEVPAKPAAKAAVFADSDSDSEEEAPKPKAKAAPAAQLPAGDDSSSEEEVVAAPKAKAAARPAVETDSECESPAPRDVPKVVAADADSDSDSDGEVAAPPKAQSTQKTIVDESSDEEMEPAKPAEQPVKSKKAKLDAAAEEPKKGSTSTANDKQKGEDDAGSFRVIVKGLPFKVKEDNLKKTFSKCGDIKHVKMLMDDRGLPRGIAFITFAAEAGVAAALKKDGDKGVYEGRNLSVERAMKQPARDDFKKNKKQPNKPADGKNKSGEGGWKEQSAPEDPTAIVNDKTVRKLVHLQQIKDFASLERLGQKIVRAAQAAQQVAKDSQKNSKKRFENCVFVKGLPAKDFNQEAFTKRFEDCGDIKFVWLPMKGDGETKGFGTIAFKTEAAFQKALKYDGTKCKGEVLSVQKSAPAKETDKGQKVKKGEADNAPKRKNEEPIDEAKKKAKHEKDESKHKARKERKEQPAVAEEVVVKKSKKEKTSN